MVELTLRYLISSGCSSFQRRVYSENVDVRTDISTRQDEEDVPSKMLRLTSREEKQMY